MRRLVSIVILVCLLFPAGFVWSQKKTVSKKEQLEKAYEKIRLYRYLFASSLYNRKHRLERLEIYYNMIYWIKVAEALQKNKAK